MPEFALEMRQISKTYGVVKANDGITFSVAPGTIHALAGENGAGKSTLMKILFGLVKPDSSPEHGIFIHGKRVEFASPLDAIRSGIGMVQQHFALAGALTALDNIILGAEPRAGGVIDRQKAEATLNALAGQHLKAPWERNAEDLSVGIQQRLEILKLLFRQANILILDEPTAVLTPQEVDVFFSLLRRLRGEGKTIILITHKLNEVLALCDTVTVLRGGKISGHFSTAGLSKYDLVRAMIGRDIKPIEKRLTRPGENIVECKDVNAGQRERGALSGLSFKIAKGEVLGIAGVEGNGQSTLVEVLLGLQKYEGKITFKGRPLPRNTAAVREQLNIGLISEDRHDQSLWLQASIADNVIIGFTKKFSRLGFMNSRKIKYWAQDLLKPYGVKMHSVGQEIASLSGGNQQKVVVAREVSARQPDFLIASQPTRGVDVGAIEFIHEQLILLRDSGAAILLISSELDELCALSDRILVLYEGRIAREFGGPQYELTQIGQVMTSGGAS